MPEVTEDLTKRRHLVAVARLNLDSEPDLVHLSVLKWWPMVEAWATGMTLCGRSASQGALPADTVVTCQDCEGLRDSYERALEGRPTVEQEEIAGLRARAAAAEATLRIARFTAEHWRNEMMKSDGTRLAAHPCAMILTALGGETDPVECGIDDWAKDAFRAVVAGDAPDCRWPACLSEDDQQLLAEQVGASMLGEATALMPDPRPGCGCVDRGVNCDWRAAQ